MFRWADQCTWAHDSDKATPKFKKVGQNMGLRYSGKFYASRIKDFSRSIQKWYDEEQYGIL